VDFTLTPTSLLSVRGGYFYDSYKDTGVPNTTSYTYQFPTTGVPGIPANLQGPFGTVNTPRVQINNFDTTKQAFLQLDYSHAFSAAGSHLVKGGWGVRRYTPQGRLLQCIAFPVANVTKLAFGGADLMTVYATTAAKGLDAAALAKQPLAGGLFRFQADAPGQPCTLVATE